MPERVHIEFQRVQTWLFAVPRLRAMVGANALLGEALRVELPALARAGGARAAGEWKLAEPEAATGFDGPGDRDPLGDEDDPHRDAADGIYSRDGGHFEAEFKWGAREFAESAAEKLRGSVPGLRFRIDHGDDRIAQSDGDAAYVLPVLHTCDWTGHGVSSVEARQGGESAEVSLEVSHRHDAAKKSESKEAKDLAGLMFRATEWGNGRARTFQSLASGGYLAVIHVDGNNVGAGMPSLTGLSQTEEDVVRANYHHRNRVWLRRALKVAMDKCAAAEPGLHTSARPTTAPLIPLMLGGDDLLVVCRAGVAAQFVVDLCAELDRMQQDASGHRLTLGVGMVVAKPTIPFQRLHEVAEQLAASAKRRYRGLAEADKASVVDWAVYSTSWIDDPTELRRRDWIRGTAEKRRVLSQRPVRVLGNGLDSLEGLISAVGTIRDAEPARSQLRRLIEQLPVGRTAAELAFRELPDGTADALKTAGITLDELWDDVDPGVGVAVTPLLDLIELYEIPLLGRIRRVENSDYEEIA